MLYSTRGRLDAHLSPGLRIKILLPDELRAQRGGVLQRYVCTLRRLLARGPNYHLPQVCEYHLHETSLVRP